MECAKALYPISVLERATRDCFFEIHDTWLGSKKIREPMVDLLSSGSLTIQNRYRHEERTLKLQ